MDPWPFYAHLIWIVPASLVFLIPAWVMYSKFANKVDPNDKDKQAKTAYLSIGIVFTSALIICSIIGFTQTLLMQKSKE